MARRSRAPPPLPGEPIRAALQLGSLVRALREQQGLKQTELAAAAGVGFRFIVDLEAGKESCHLGKALRVLDRLGAALVARQGNMRSSRLSGESATGGCYAEPWPTRRGPTVGPDAIAWDDEQ